MCGIFGFANLEKKPLRLSELVNLKAIYRYLSIENQMRGKDSTGLALFSQSNVPFMARRTIKSTDFIQHPLIEKKTNHYFNRETKFLLGHTRAATTGIVNVQNAQPFKYGPIIGTHNGIIHNFEAMFQTSGLPAFTTCDSEIIFALLSKPNTLQDKADRLAGLNGYLSIAFIDERIPNTLSFARFNNTLSIRMSKDERLLFWSSQANVLDQMSLIFGVELEDIELKDGFMIEIDQGTKEIRRHKIKEIVNNWAAGTFQDYWDRVQGRRRIGFEKQPYKIPVPSPRGEYSFKTKCSICTNVKWCAWKKEFFEYTCEDCYLLYARLKEAQKNGVYLSKGKRKKWRRQIRNILIKHKGQIPIDTSFHQQPPGCATDGPPTGEPPTGFCGT